MRLKHALLNQPIEVPALRTDLAKLFGLPERRPDLALWFERSEALPFLRDGR